MSRAETPEERTRRRLEILDDIDKGEFAHILTNNANWLMDEDVIANFYYTYKIMWEIPCPIIISTKKRLMKNKELRAELKRVVDGEVDKAVKAERMKAIGLIDANFKSREEAEKLWQKREIELGRHINLLTIDNTAHMEELAKVKRELAKVKRELATVKEELAKVSGLNEALPNMNW
tara:strand:+ start:86 stop:616 length:531 start_codon:yes stop_codon:yes gene_type:complete